MSKSTKKVKGSKAVLYLFYILIFVLAYFLGQNVVDIMFFVNSPTEFEEISTFNIETLLIFTTIIAIFIIIAFMVTKKLRQ